MLLLNRLALRISATVGSPYGFAVAIVLVLGWIAAGVATRWNQAWLLWPSAIASVATFLIAFSLQYTQNRDTRAIQLKLDEILHAQEGAREHLMKIELLPDHELGEVEHDILRRRDRRTR